MNGCLARLELKSGRAEASLQFSHMPVTNAVDGGELRRRTRNKSSTGIISDPTCVNQRDSVTVATFSVIWN